MGFTRGCCHAVSGKLHFAALQPLLQGGLGVLALHALAGAQVHRLVQAANQGIRGIEPGVQVHGAQNRLKGIGQDGRPLAPAGTDLSLSQAQQRRELEHIRQAMQRVLLHQIGTDA